MIGGLMRKHRKTDQNPTLQQFVAYQSAQANWALKFAEELRGLQPPTNKAEQVASNNLERILYDIREGLADLSHVLTDLPHHQSVVLRHRLDSFESMEPLGVVDQAMATIQSMPTIQEPEQEMSK